MDNNIESKLLNYQIPHFYQLDETMIHNKCILDASDTGTGKTYVAIALALKNNLKPFVICPKSVIKSWIKVGKHFGVKFAGIVNYELFKSLRYYHVTDDYDIEKKNCDNIYKFKTFDKKKKRYDLEFAFNFPQDTLIIFDEAHRCKNHKTTTSKLLLGMKMETYKILLLSATISDKLDCFRPFGVIFDFYKSEKDYKYWLKRNVKYLTGPDFYKNKDNQKQIINFIHNKVFPYKGSRMKIADLGDLFPKNKIIMDSYYSENSDLINKEYEKIKFIFDDIVSKQDNAENRLAQIVMARMSIEMLKIPIIVDLAKEGLDNGYSIVIFVNFTDTLMNLCEILKTNCIVCGDQSMNERQENIDRFQSNESNIIILMIQAGGVGISLHDVHHNSRPRMSLINPTWSGQDMLQALGRIHRAGSQSVSIQKIIYVSETYEEEIKALVESKIINVTGINDMDMDGLKTIKPEDMFLQNT